MLICIVVPIEIVSDEKVDDVLFGIVYITLIKKQIFLTRVVFLETEQEILTV